MHEDFWSPKIFHTVDVEILLKETIFFSSEIPFFKNAYKLYIICLYFLV